MKYIDADRLRAEIDGIISAIQTHKHPDEFGSTEQCMAAAEVEALNLVLDTIKELQQEQPVTASWRHSKDCSGSSKQHLTDTNHDN